MTLVEVWETPDTACHHKPLGHLCVDLIGPYTLKGNDGTEIDFMCLNIIDPSPSWFEIGEVTVTMDAVIPLDTKGQRVLRHIITYK